MRPLTNALVLGLLLLLGVFLLVGRGSTPSVPPCADRPSDPACEAWTADDGAIMETRAGPSVGPTLRADDVCPGAGYLCAGLSERGISRVMRWPDGIDEIEVRIPRPEFLDPTEARDLQSAAMRGILAWQNSPFPIRVTRSDRPGSEDFAVTWARRLNGRELGRTGTRWENRDGVAEMDVTEFVLTTHAPGTTGQLLDTRQVQLTAAHEMGHALGLPHSDEERDLMFPTNTASRLSTRDYRVMEALYGLENGAEILDASR